MPTAIHADKKCVCDFLKLGADKPFVIPEYQRPYAWGADEIQTLFKDIWDFTVTSGGSKRKNASYFLGCIVSFENSSDEQEIIDGQQRITSLFLLLRAIYAKLDSGRTGAEAENFKKQIAPLIWRADPLTGEINNEEILLCSRVINNDGNQVGRIANAIMDLCAGVLPEYVDDSKGPDLVGRNILWRMGMIAWNIAVSGRKEISDDSIRQMNLDAELQKMVRDEVNRLVRKKYAMYPELRTSISDVSVFVIAGVPRLKVSLGETFPEFPVPEFDEEPQTLTPEEILTKRKELKLSQAKFTAELGISVKKLSAWEHGKAVPTDAEVTKINLFTPGKE